MQETGILQLKERSLDQLKAKYEELFGQKTVSNHKVYLWRKIAYRMQEIEFGGLSANVKQKLEELIKKYDPANNVQLRPKSDQSESKVRSSRLDRRLPIPGSVITKKYRGQTLLVKVLENGFEYNGKIYKTISAVATDIAGVHWNGYMFFGL